MVVFNRVREIREQKMRQSGEPEIWTQEGVAKRLGITRQTLISMEKGTYNPSLELALKIARIFEVRVDDIFELRDDENGAR
ncbi:MAG: helix-turn-helix transcriptional regulator [Candidatus Thorarchaeota archaeon]